MCRSIYSQKISFTDIFSNLKSICKFVLVLNFFGLVFQVQQKKKRNSDTKTLNFISQFIKKIKTKQSKTK